MMKTDSNVFYACHKYTHVFALIQNNCYNKYPLLVLAVDNIVPKNCHSMIIVVQFIIATGF